MKLRESSKKRPGYFSSLLKADREAFNYNQPIHIEISLPENNNNNHLGSLALSPNSRSNSCNCSPRIIRQINKKNSNNMSPFNKNERLLIQLRYLLNHIVIPNMSAVPSLQKLYKEIVKIVEQNK